MTDHGGKSKKMTIKSAWVQQHVNNILNYGPLPRNWEVELGRNKALGKDPTSGKEKVLTTIRYLETTKMSRHHPNSPQGRRERPVILDEFRDEREEKTGLYHPPLPAFKVGDLDFHGHNSWQKAMAAALAEDGTTIGKDNDRPSADHMKVLDTRFTTMALKDARHDVHHEVYHQADYDRVVFNGEPQASRVASKLDRSLAILAPVTMADGRGYDRFWQQHDRPPMQWRWSTGPQCTKLCEVEQLMR